MKKTEFLTIVIAYYNIKFFDNTLNSLAAQTDKNFKVFIGNDCSPENPCEIIKKYKKDISIQYVEFSDNLGGSDLTLQWKRCLEYVTTPFFLILGDDDLLSKNSILEFNKEINSLNINELVYRFSIQRINEKGEKISNVITYQNMESSVDFVIKRANNEVVSSLGEYIFSTEQYRKVGIKSYPKAFYSDNMMVLQISNFGLIKNIENAISFIRVSQYSFSGNSNNNQYIHEAAALFYYDLIIHYFEYFKNKNIRSFLPSLLYGKKHNLIDIKWKNLLSLCIKYNGYNIVANLLLEKVKSLVLTKKVLNE